MCVDLDLKMSFFEFFLIRFLFYFLLNLCDPSKYGGGVYNSVRDTLVGIRLFAFTIP